MLKLQEIPTAAEINMIVGWRQWADAGSISSGLPEYLIKHTNARKIGEIDANGFYLFQIPGMHHLLRPIINLKDGYRQSLEQKKNEFFYTGDENRGLVIFLGDEPHLEVNKYAEQFFQAVKTLGVKRVAGIAGVFGPLPYDKDRHVSCIYSLPRMKPELEKYAVNFSDYEGGASIGSLLVDRAEPAEIEFVVFYGFVPAYDFSQSALQPQGMRIDNDFKAWYDLMQRLNHLFNLEIDLSGLKQQSDELLAAMEAKITEMAENKPQLNVHAYIEKLNENFTEQSFVPLDDVWEDELRDIFGGEE